MYIYLGSILLLFVLIGFIVYKTQYKQFDDKPLIFYHPTIKNKYCKIIILQQHSPNRSDLKTVMDNLVKENNYLLEYYPYNNMIDRFNTIKNNRKLQTIFNLLDI